MFTVRSHCWCGKKDSEEESEMAAEWKETLETEREISAFMLELGIPAHLRILLSEGGGFAGCLGYGTGWQRDEAVISGDRKAL